MLHTAGDGFFLNVSWVLLRLCSPFITPSIGSSFNPKLMNVDPGYCTLGSTANIQQTPPHSQTFVNFSHETKMTSRGKRGRGGREGREGGREGGKGGRERKLHISLFHCMNN